MIQSFQANGKLLLTGEYFVLEGALALALPVNFGQSLTVSPALSNSAQLHWKSLDEKRDCWFEGRFDQEHFTSRDNNDPKTAEQLGKIFREIVRMQSAGSPDPDRFRKEFTTQLTFPRLWGFGSSSTLVYLLARWAGVDPYVLQFNTFGGSGYDIACADATGPVLYKLQDGIPIVKPSSFHPPFKDHLYFVYLGRKQNSREGIARFRSRQNKQEKEKSIQQISQLTLEFEQSRTLEAFDMLIREHEQVTGHAIGLPRAKDLYFQNFWGEVKSLGAWGGDFVLVTSNRSEDETRRYFEELDHTVFFTYEELILQQKG